MRNNPLLPSTLNWQLFFDELMTIGVPCSPAEKTKPCEKTLQNMMSVLFEENGSQKTAAVDWTVKQIRNKGIVGYPPWVLCKAIQRFQPELPPLQAHVSLLQGVLQQGQTSRKRMLQVKCETKPVSHSAVYVQLVQVLVRWLSSNHCF